MSIKKNIIEYRSIYTTLIFVLIVIIGIGVVTFRSVDEVYEAAELRANSYNMLSATERILTELSLAEENQRSFLITEQQIDLDHFQSAKKNVIIGLQKLEQLSKYNKEQSARVDSLFSLVLYRIDVLDRQIEKQRTGQRESVLLDIRRGIGKTYTRYIRQKIVEIEMKEYDNLAQRDQQVVATVKNASITIFIGTLVSCVIFLSGFYVLNREVREKMHAENAMRIEKEFSDRLLNSSIDGIIAFDINRNLTLWNPGIEAMMGIRKTDAIGKDIFNTLPFLKEIGEDKNIYETLKGNYCISKDKWYYLPETNKKGYFEAYYSPIYAADKKLEGGLSIIRNTTRRKLALDAIEKTKDMLEQRVSERTSELSKLNEDLKKEIEQRKIAQEQSNASLQEKIVLLREIHHRVKNNLQVISSLLNLQSGYIEDKKALEIFRESQNRVRSMALIHEKLYQSKNLNKVDFSEYMDSLSSELFRSYNVDPAKIKLSCSVDGILLGIDIAILCGLIVNELLSNSLKHAFPEGERGDVVVSLAKNINDKFELIVKDNGVGFPKNIDYKNTDSLGLQLVNTLAMQLGGEIELNQNEFTEFKIEFEM